MIELDAWNTITRVCAAWLVTYGMHSTALIVGALVVTRTFRRLPAMAADVLWKVAMFAGMLTATVQIAAAPAMSTSAVHAASRESGGYGDFVILNISGFESRPMDAASNHATANQSSWTTPVSLGIPAIAFIGVLLLSRRWVVSRSRLHHIGDRMRLDEAHRAARFVREMTEANAAASSVAVTRCDGAAMPFALGRSEICLPARALDSLADAELRSLLAHEYAHLRRGDAYWRTACDLVCGLLFVQPLHFLARRRIHACAELICDEWAARHVGSGMPLATCLAEAQSWLGNVTAAPGVGMIAHESQFVSRVRRLVETPPTRRPAYGAATLAAVLAFGLASATLCLPRVGGDLEHPTTPRASAAGMPALTILDASGTAVVRDDSAYPLPDVPGAVRFSVHGEEVSAVCDGVAVPTDRLRHDAIATTLLDDDGAELVQFFPWPGGGWVAGARTAPAVGLGITVAATPSVSPLLGWAPRSSLVVTAAADEFDDGLCVGDLIQRVDQQAVRSLADLRHVLRHHFPPSRDVEFEVLRAGVVRTAAMSNGESPEISTIRADDGRTTHRPFRVQWEDHRRLLEAILRCRAETKAQSPSDATGADRNDWMNRAACTLIERLRMLQTEVRSGGKADKLVNIDEPESGDAGVLQHRLETAHDLLQTTEQLIDAVLPFDAF